MRLLFFASLLATLPLTAQESYAITVDVEGYDEEYLTLANYLLDSQYIIDTAYRADDGSYVLSNDTTALPRGIYLVVLSPDNQYFQFVVGDDEDQEFTLRTRKEDLSVIEAESSEENRLFYDYLTFLDGMQKKSASEREVLSDSSATEARRMAAEAQMKAYDEEVAAHQSQLITEHPDAFVSAIVRSNQAITPPEFTEIEDGDTRREKQWRWLQEHYFDNIDLKDDRLLHTPFLFQRIDYFVHKLHVQHPDSIAEAIDKVLGRMDPQSDFYKFYVIRFINDAAKSQLVGMDAVYVHMVDKYYANGKAWWSDEEQQRKMLENADRTRPLLIGKTAPNINMTLRSGESVDLYSVDAKYTILYFWQPDCPSCKKSTPHMAEFYEKWKDRDVAIFSVCTKRKDELTKCWDYVDEKKIGDWVHTVDPYQRYYKAYDIRSTPTIFLLDREKEIISKRIGAQQLDEVLTAIEKDRAAQSAGK